MTYKQKVIKLMERKRDEMFEDERYFDFIDKINLNQYPESAFKDFWLSLRRDWGYISPSESCIFCYVNSVDNKTYCKECLYGINHGVCNDEYRKNLWDELCDKYDS